MKPSKGKEYFLVGLQLLLMVLLVYPLRLPEFIAINPHHLLSLLTMLLSVLLGVVAIYQMRRHISAFPSPRSGSRLLSTGVYQYIRHPMYTAIICFGFGLSVYLWSIDKLLITMLLLILFEVKSQMEEILLDAHFKNYELYKLRTGKFIPLFFKSVSKP